MMTLKGNTTKSTILKYTQHLLVCTIYTYIYMWYMYIHTERQIDRHIHTCITYTNGDGNFNIRLRCTRYLFVNQWKSPTQFHETSYEWIHSTALTSPLDGLLNSAVKKKICDYRPHSLILHCKCIHWFVTL